MSIIRQTIILLVFGFLIASLGCNDSGPAETEAAKIIVRLEIHFEGAGDDLSKEFQIVDQQTVFELLQHASAEGFLQFEHSGYGETSTFIASIDGVNSQWADGANWLFWVNEQMADVGCGAYRLSDGDRVAWKFSEKYLE